MADATTDPNAAPMHLEVRTKFASIHIAIIAFVGSAAIIAGVVLGVVLAND
ncbi:MAG: hypothetical protein HYX53_04380 [Chloroflexi bacterium]|nr:hypothetical protein [Chloroflexota bacterium]